MQEITIRVDPVIAGRPGTMQVKAKIYGKIAVYPAWRLVARYEGFTPVHITAEFKRGWIVGHIASGHYLHEVERILDAAEVAQFYEQNTADTDYTSDGAPFATPRLLKVKNQAEQRFPFLSA